ncbi:hypothetical protein ACFPRL_27895 [Pseudoclavibacter helvolus]
MGSRECHGELRSDFGSDKHSPLDREVVKELDDRSRGGRSAILLAPSPPQI